MLILNLYLLTTYLGRKYIIIVSNNIYLVYYNVIDIVNNSRVLLSLGLGGKSSSYK